MVLYLISLLVFLGVGSGFMKSGLDVWLLVWDHFILFNIPLENTTMNVRLNIVLLQLTTLSENFRIFINSYDFLWVTLAQEFMSTQICYKVMKCLTCWNNKLPTKIMSQRASKILVIHKHSPPVTKFFIINQSTKKYVMLRKEMQSLSGLGLFCFTFSRMMSISEYLMPLTRTGTKRSMWDCNTSLQIGCSASDSQNSHASRATESSSSWVLNIMYWKRFRSVKAYTWIL